MEYTKLEADFKKRWLLALRSGQYKQGMGQLHNVHTDEYCCLGVACMVASVKQEWIDFGDMVTIGMVNKFPVLKPLCGMIDNASASMVLMYMNDKEDKTFAEIANWVEKCL